MNIVKASIVKTLKNLDMKKWLVSYLVHIGVMQAGGVLASHLHLVEISHNVEWLQFSATLLVVAAILTILPGNPIGELLWTTQNKSAHGITDTKHHAGCDQHVGREPLLS